MLNVFRQYLNSGSFWPSGAAVACNRSNGRAVELREVLIQTWYLKLHAGRWRSQRACCCMWRCWRRGAGASGGRSRWVWHTCRNLTDQTLQEIDNRGKSKCLESMSLMGALENKDASMNFNWLVTLLNITFKCQCHYIYNILSPTFLPWFLYLGHP